VVQRTLPALQEYLELFKPYEELLRLDPAEYVAERTQQVDLSTEETKALVVEHLASEQQVLAEIPDMVVVGLFEVSCVEIRKTLASRHKKVADLLLDVMLLKFRESTQEICDTFTGVFAQLRKAPKKIEESTDLKDYMSNVPGEVKKIEPEVTKCIAAYNILESFGVKMTADDSFQRWRVFQSPKQTYDMMAQVEEDLKASDQSFAADMAAEQSEFDDNLLDLAGIIETFAQYSDAGKVKEIYENVESVNERLKQANVQAKLFNSREVLLGKESSDYSQLQALQKEWDPFSQLWVTAYHWIDDSEKWMNGAFGDIDSRHCEQSVFHGAKTLFKVVKAFEKREDAGKVLAIAKDIKEKVDAFQPYVPIVMGLRNQGMRDRHWEHISNLVGEKVHPDMEDFTLNNFLKGMNMLPHAHEIQEIGDRSGKELGIEKQLNSMKAAWEDVRFDCSEPYRTTETYILKGADDVMALLDEQIVTVQAMQFSPFNKPFK
jgi:dynein heavy chain